MSNYFGGLKIGVDSRESPIIRRLIIGHCLYYQTPLVNPYYGIFILFAGSIQFLWLNSGTLYSGTLYSGALYSGTLYSGTSNRGTLVFE